MSTKEFAGFSMQKEVNVLQRGKHVSSVLFDLTAKQNNPPSCASSSPESGRRRSWAVSSQTVRVRKVL